MLKRTTVAPGIYPGMSFEEYIALDAINHSSLEWAVTHSPEHFHYHHFVAEPEPSTPDQEFGQIIHKAFLEPKDFKDRISIGPVNPATKKTYGRGTKAWDAEQAATTRILLREDEFATLKGMRARALTIPPIMHALGLAGGINECVAVWKDPETGLLCKGRADRFVPGTILLDLKSTRCAAARQFGRDAANFGYHRQAPWYAKGFPLACEASDLDAANVPVAFLAFEKDPPYAMAIYHLAPAEMSIGEAENAEALARVAECTRTGEWPSYPQTVQTLQLPAWAVPNVEATL